MCESGQSEGRVFLRRAAIRHPDQDRHQPENENDGLAGGVTAAESLMMTLDTFKLE
jgi:hypothetical protein